MSSSFSPVELRNINARRVLQMIYSEKEISKQAISEKLQLSLPTVTANLKKWEDYGLVERQGLFESTGGRKAQIYRFVATSHISVGALMLKELFRIVAVDLYGQIIDSYEENTPFVYDESYLKHVGTAINTFIDHLSIPTDKLLGVGVALQGLISTDGNEVIYGRILHCDHMTLDEIQRHVNAPCFLIHDTEASALAELWNDPSTKDAVLIYLARYLGGAVITEGTIFQGCELSSSILEHMCLYPNGRTCYCGKHGCNETYCSAYALQQEANEPLDSFFMNLHEGFDEGRQSIWHNYLHNLAIAINNIRMLMDTEFILGGYLMQFINDDDINLLKIMVENECPFSSSGIKIRKSAYLGDSAAPGAAIWLVKKYLTTMLNTL